MAIASRPGLGIETLHDFADLQRQVGERVAPLRTREHLRRRAAVRRRVKRAVILLVPLVLAALVAVDTGGSRTWIDHRWGDLNRSTSGQPGDAVGG